MDAARWAKHLDILRNYTFKIDTPNGSGTGFLFKCEKADKVCGLVTAYHVISHAHSWDETIKITHATSLKQIVLRNNPQNQDRYIFANPKHDVSAIMFINENLDLPKDEISLCPEDKSIKQGIEIGWAGFPSVAPNNFSFFCGAISCFLPDQIAYLVDGVAINGVSGGPAFTDINGKINIIGVVTAYIPNRATGETLPGVCFVKGIHPLYEIIKDINSVEEAIQKSKQNESEVGGQVSK